jgi:DNA replication and repair protein RecF
MNVIEFGIGINKKKVKINKQEVKLSEIFSQVPVVNFSPDDLQLIKGGPQGRRDFIDLYLAQIEPKYRFVYYNFYKVLQQRNRFLKEMQYTQAENEVWDEQLIAKGTKVIKYRADLIEKIKPYICSAHQRISRDHEILNIEYSSLGSNANHLKDESEIRELFESLLHSVRNQERERKMTLIGPQRDDLLLTINEGIELRNFGSQGQQRTASLALKLGMIDILTDFRGTYPILLLDDVMSEFDDSRKKALLRMLINSSQTFLTSTSINDFQIDPSEHIAFYRVKQGEALKNG